MKLFLLAVFLVAVVCAVPLDGEKGETSPIVADMEGAELFHKAHKAKAYGAPKAHKAPKASYGAPKAKAPKAAYGAPKAYHAPAPAYHAPAPAYHAPAPVYHAPAPVYHAPPKAKGLHGLKALKAHKGGDHY